MRATRILPQNDFIILRSLWPQYWQKVSLSDQARAWQRIHTADRSTVGSSWKVDIAESIKTQAILKKQMVCTYDDFSVNGTMNRIIKATVELLLKSDISKTRKKELRKLMVFFLDVEPIDLYSVNWNIQYNRNNQTYRLLISVCYLVVKVASDKF